MCELSSAYSLFILCDLCDIGWVTPCWRPHQWSAVLYSAAHACRYFASTLLSLHLNYIMPSTMESSGTIIHFMHVMISTSVALSVFALASIVVLGCENLAGSSGENVSKGKNRSIRRNMARSKITNNLSWTTTERYKWTRKSICIEWIKCSAYE